MYNKKDFKKLTYTHKRYAFIYQNLSWLERKDFEKLTNTHKRYAFIYQNLSWFKREDFEKLDEYQKRNALINQNLSWFKREDFEKLDEYQKSNALINQNLSWFKREDFEKLDEYQKRNALINQNLSWFTKKLLGKFYKIHKKRTKRQCLKEIKDYAKEYNLTFDGKYLFVFRNHDKFGHGQYRKNIFYESGKYYKDWHLNADEIEQNSFGFGIFPKGNTSIKVHVDDWG